MLNSRLFEIYFLKIKSYPKKFMHLFINNSNFRLLWLELLLFSVIFGASLHSWPMFCLVYLGLSWILNKQKGMPYMVYVSSFIWGLAAIFIGYCLSGWGWAAVWGMFTFVCSITIHFRDLKQPLYNERVIEDKNIIESNQNWNYRWQNLN